MEPIGPYRIVSEVARGGMGVVYRAQGPRGEDVALKLLLAHKAASSKARQRFQVEIQALSRLKHANVVPILNAGEHRGIPWLALPFVEGESLAQRLESGRPLPVWEAIRITEQLAQALTYVHQCGVVHRDLKPANVLLRGAQALLTDFGIARDEEASSTRLTASGAFLGTPGYWAPELARGERSAVGRRTDVYGLGAVLYACLTGRSPIEANSLHEHLDALLSRRIAPPQELRGEVPQWLSDLCMRCLATDPGDRPESTEAVGAALTRAEAGSAQRRGTPAPLVVGLAVTAVLLAGLTLWIVLSDAGGTDGEPASSRAAAEPSTPGSNEPNAATLKARELTAEAQVIVDTEGLTADELETAHARFNEALGHDPDHVPALIGRGRTRMLLSDAQGALADFERVLELEPRNSLAYAGRATLNGARGHHAEALRDYDRALALDPDNSIVTYNRGLTKSYMSNFSGALEDFERALALRPDQAEVHADRGLIYMRQGKLPAALADLDRAIELRPSYATAHHNRALVNAMLGRTVIALADLDESIRLDPEFAGSYMERGKAYAQLQRFDEAIRDLTRALELQPNVAEGYAQRARAHSGAGNVDRALEDYTRAIEIDPRLGVAWGGRAVIYAKLGRMPEALRDLDEAVRLEPAAAELLINRANVLQKLSRPQDALSDLTRAKELNPRQPVTFAKRALLLHELGRSAEGLRDVEAALQLDVPPSMRRGLEQLRAQIAASLE